jgi:hypothetical protein
VAKSSTLVQDVVLVTQLVQQARIKATLAKLSSNLIRSTGSLKRQERAQRMRTEFSLTGRMSKKVIKQSMLLELKDGPKQRRRSSNVVDFFMRRKQTAKVAPTLSVPGEEQTPGPVFLQRRDSFGEGVHSVATSIRPLAEGPDTTTREAIADICLAAGVPQENIDMVFTVADFDPNNVACRSFVAVLSTSFVRGSSIDACRVASSMFVEAMCEATNVSSIAHTEVSLAVLELASLDPTLDDKDVLVMCTELEAAARQGGGLVSPTGLFKPTAARRRLKRKNSKEEREKAAKPKPTRMIGDAGDESVWSLAPDIDLSYLGRIKAKLDTGMKRPRHRKIQLQFKIASDLNLDGLRNQNLLQQRKSARLDRATFAGGGNVGHNANSATAVAITERPPQSPKRQLLSNKVLPLNFQKLSVAGITPTVLPPIRLSDISLSALPPCTIIPGSSA